MKHRIGMLLESLGRIVTFLILLTGFVYVVGVSVGMLAPVWSAFKMSVTIALLPLAIA